MIQKNQAIIIFIILVVLIFFLAYQNNLTFWASAVISLAIALTIISLLYPEWRNDGFLMVVGAVGSLLIFFYAFLMALNDKRT